MNDEQQLLVQAIFSQTENKQFECRGLAVYQRNLQDNANRALQVTFPTVNQLIGEQAFGFASNKLLQSSPPTGGDWGEWGGDFPQLLDTLPELFDYPYIADCARLDFAIHHQQRSKDLSVDFESMQLLATGNLDRLYIGINPNIEIIQSDFPLVDIYLIHQQEAENDSIQMNAAQKKLQLGVGQTALIYRPEFKSLVRVLYNSELQWLDLIKRGQSIGMALDSLADSDFHFQHWLPTAVAQNLITHLESH